MVLRRNSRQLQSGASSSRGSLPSIAPNVPESMTANPWPLLIQLSQAMAGGSLSPGQIAQSTSPCLALTAPSPPSQPTTVNPEPGWQTFGVDSCHTPPPARSATPTADVWPVRSSPLVDFGETQRVLALPDNPPVQADTDDVEDVDFYSNLISSAIKQRPAARSSGPPPKKKPTPIVHDSRPSMPADNAGTTFYGEGKVLVSVAKSSYRVFRHRTDRVDKLVRWHGDQPGAWERALDFIDGKW